MRKIRLIFITPMRRIFSLKLIYDLSQTVLCVIVDVTWDIKKKGDISCIYDYLNLNDSLIKLDHTWDDKIIPRCNSVKHNYYNKNKLYVRSLDQIPDYICRKIAGGETSIVFKFAEKLPAQVEIVEKISLGLSKALCFQGWVYCINERQHNVYIELRPR